MGLFICENVFWHIVDFFSIKNYGGSKGLTGLTQGSFRVDPESYRGKGHGDPYWVFLLE